jgi:hypothetical protein
MSLYSPFRKSLCTYKRYWKWCQWVSIQAWTRLILFTNTLCRSSFRKSLCTYKRCWKWCPRASIQAWTCLILSTYRSLSAQKLSKCTVVNFPVRTISRKKTVGRPRLQYLKQVTRNTAADSYTAVKRMTCNNSRWKAPNWSKVWRIIIRSDTVLGDPYFIQIWLEHTYKMGSKSTNDITFIIQPILTLSNPIFLPPPYSPALIYFGQERVAGLLVIILQF